VLAAFSDPAGAKAVLAYLWLHGAVAASVTAVSNRRYPFYADFKVPVLQSDWCPAETWLDNVDMLITGTSIPQGFELELIEAATARGIESCAFVDHWTNLAQRFERGGVRTLPTTIALVDERARMLALAAGLPEERLTVTGNPHHEYLRSWRPSAKRRDMPGVRDLASGLPYVLYAPEPLSRFGLKATYGFDEIDGWLVLRAAREASGGAQFAVVIKAHANQEHTRFEAVLEPRADPTVVYLRDGDLPALCHHAAAVVGFFSNSLIEARGLGRPVVRPLIGMKAGTPDPLELFEAPDFRTVRDLPGLVAALDEILVRAEPKETIP
jgi:hypothetical protein